MFRRNRRLQSTPVVIGASKKRNASSLNSKETKKLKKFNQEPKEETVVTIKISSNKKNKKTKNKHRQSYAKLKWASPSNRPQSYNSYPNTSENKYIIAAYLQNGILTITVNFGTKTFRQQFTQNSFHGISIYKASKILIQCIQKSANKTNKNNKYKHRKKRISHPNDMKTKDIKIFEYNGYCYVTLLNSNLPSFALRPVHELTSNLNGVIVNSNKKRQPKKRQRYSAPNRNDLYAAYMKHYYNTNTNTNTNENRNHNTQKWNQNVNTNNIHNTNHDTNDWYYRNSSNDTVVSNTLSSTGIKSMHSNYNYSNYGASDDTNTIITVEDNDKADKGPGFIDQEYYHKRRMTKDTDNIKYGFV